MACESPLILKPDYLVCTCMGVMYSEISSAIKNGCVTYESLAEQLLVGSGCSSCVQEVHDILREELRALKDKQN